MCFAAFVGGHRLRKAKMLDLRIGKDLSDVVYLARRNTGLVHRLDPFCGCLANGDGFDFSSKGIAVLGACRGGGKTLVFKPILAAKGSRKACPDLFARDGEVHVSVLGSKNARRDGCGVIVASLFWYVAVHQEASSLEIQHEDLGLQKRRLNPLAASGFLSFKQSDKDTLSRKKTRAEIGDGDAYAHRPFSGFAGDGHKAAHPLRDLIETRTTGKGAVLSEPGNRCEY